MFSLDMACLLGKVGILLHIDTDFFNHNSDKKNITNLPHALAQNYSTPAWRVVCLKSSYFICRHLGFQLCLLIENV